MACARRQSCRTTLHTLVLTTVFLSTISWTSRLAHANEANEVRAWFELHSIPEKELQQQRDSSSLSSRSSVKDSTKETIWKPVSQGWGIGDAVATVGRVFKYAIPKEAFRGDISRYEVIEAGEDRLPGWLFYNGNTQTLEGIPSEADMDQYYITTTAYGRETNGTISQATDVFSVSVVPDVTGKSGTTTATPVNDAPSRGVKCSDDEPGVTATIVLDADWGKLGAKKRMESISKMSQYSRLGVEQFRLLPAGSKSLLDSSVLVAGPGNVKRAEHPGVALSWQIGCGTEANKFPVVTILELASKDGSMATKLGHNIIGWHVTHDRSKVKRVRRQANLMGTPVPTPTPTDMPPKPSAIPETSVIPSTRVIPTESSPVFSSMMRTGASSGIMPTKMITKPATETARRTLSASPSHKPPTRTKPVSYITPSMAPSPLPPQPSASTIYTTAIEPTPVPVTEVPTRTFEPPMPSMTAVEMTPSMIATILPTRTFTPVEETTMAVDTTMKLKPTPTPPSKPNTPPKVLVPITRVDAMVLKFFTFRIPENTFIDAEDGNTRRLSLTMLNLDTGKELGEKSWVQFDKATQTMRGLPLEKDKGRYSYVIAAQDKEGLTVRMVMELVVKPAPPVSEEPPPVTMGMSLDIDFDEFMSNPALQLDIMNRIAAVFGDADPSAITFTNIQRGSVILSWTNNTIPTDGCNAELIEEIMSKLIGPDGEPTQELKDSFYPLEITGVEAIKTGPCASPTPPLTTPDEGPGKGTSTSEDIWISTVLPAVVIAIILLIAGIIIFILYRKNRKGKLSDEDQNTFINKGIPIIFADELEDAEKPPSSSTPLIMREEKPPLPPPEYSPEAHRQPLLTNANNSRNRNSDSKQNVPMVDLSGSPPYQPPPPLSPSPPESRNSRPGNAPTYRAPPAYVPP